MDPRIARTHQAVMDAASALLMEGGPSAITMDAVVLRSGVAKSTMYRHWATRDELVADVFGYLVPKMTAPDPSLDFEHALRSLVEQMLRNMADPRFRKTVPALLLLKMHQREIAAVEERINDDQRIVFAEVFQRGVVAGRVPADSDTDLLITLLVGPLMMAMMMDTADLDGSLAERAITQFLAGLPG
jgi:AcrR family transcriptional regulator